MHRPLPSSNLLAVSRFTNDLDKLICCNHRLLVIQHLTPDVEMFIRQLLLCNFASLQVISIEYSADSRVTNRLREGGINTLEPSFDELTDVVRAQMYLNLREAERLGQRLIIHEVGGYAAPTVAQFDKVDSLLCAGVVEETAQGKWQYELHPTLPVPVLHTATGHIKQIESQFIGEAVVNSMRDFISTLGLETNKLRFSIFGYGMIGSAVARCLKEITADVSVYDIDPLRMLNAYVTGYDIGPRGNLLGESDVIVGATGVQSISPEDLKLLKDGVILCSASSKQVEFPIKEIEGTASNVVQLATDIRQYTLSNSKAIILLHDGFPINLGYKNVPVQIMDLLHAETLLCMFELMGNRYEPGLHGVPQWLESLVSTVWLDLYSQ